MVGSLILGKYQIRRPLDEGGMSRVYLAHDGGGREVVVKVLKEALRAQPRVCEHFRREIHITAHFRHPYAVGFVDADPHAPGGPVLVLEYLHGVDLHALLHREKRFAVERTGRLLAQLCGVLQAAHEAGVVHRDLKPANLMVLGAGAPSEQLRLMDFGLAKMSSLFYISPDELFDYTLPPAAGTPEYIAPEQVRGSEMDGRGDLYSVGVLLYEMLTGRRPFLGASAQELMRAHAEQAPPPFAELGLPEPIPPAVERLVRDCLAKHPDRRPATAADLLQRFELAVGRRFPLPRPGVCTPAVRAAVDAEADDANAVRHSIEANMPEAMALVKLKGFLHDLGGDVVESLPGLIRVRLPDPDAGKRPTVFDWLAAKRRTAVAPARPATDVELHVRRPDPSRPGRLTVTLVMRAGGGVTPEWTARCTRISRDLQAYLIGG